MYFSLISGHERIPPMDEVSVVAAATRGDAGAFSVLAATYRKKIMNRVRRLTGNLDDAEDVTQQALTKAFMNIRGFRGMCSFSSWLMRIAVNEALMLKRKPRARFEREWASGSVYECGVVLDIADARPNPEQCYDKHERYQLVKDALKALKTASRLPLEICDLNENSIKDLALMQGSSLSAAKSRLFRSRKLLRATVNRSLYGQAAARARLSRQPA